MIKVFGATDTSFNSNGDIIIVPLSAVVHNEMDGEFYLELTADLKYESWLERGNILVAPTPQGYQAFRIDNPVKTPESVETKAMHVYYDSNNYLALAKKLKKKTGTEIITALNNDVVPASPFTVSADSTAKRNFTIEDMPYSEALELFRARWKEHLVRDNFNISFVQNIGVDRGITIEYAKNLAGISCEENWDEVCTTILPTGKGGIKLNLVDSHRSIFINADVQYGIPYVRTVSFEQDDIEKEDYSSETAYKNALVADLQEQAEDYLNEYKYPKINYAIESYVADYIDIGDIIEVKDSRLGVDILTNVIAYDYNCITGIYESLEFGTFANRLSNLVPTINNKVNKEIGKGLSSNDFTDEDVTKLDSVQTGANVNVQPNWNESDPLSDSYILNKPTIPTLTIDSALSSTSENPVQNKVINSALNRKIDSTDIGANNGVCGLDSSGLVDIANLPNRVLDAYPTGSFLETSDSAFSPVASFGGTWSKEDITDDCIVDEGVSGIWRYRKWKSGIAECWGHNDTSQTFGSWGSLYFTNIPQINFPSGLFIEAPVCEAQTRMGNEANTVSSINGVAVSASKTAGLTVIRATTAPSLTATTYYHAVGLWKTYVAPTTIHRWHRTA